MPDAGGNIKGIALGGKAGEILERVFGPRTYTQEQSEFIREAVANRKPLGVEPLPFKECDWCPGVEATHDISGCPACNNCWEKAYNLD